MFKTAHIYIVCISSLKAPEKVDKPNVKAFYDSKERVIFKGVDVSIKRIVLTPHRTIKHAVLYTVYNKLGTLWHTVDVIHRC